MARILLSKSKKLGGVNESCQVRTELSSTSRLLPLSELKGKMDLMAEYNFERDNCTKFRITAGIHPYLTNVLFNRKTEVVKDEGSDGCVCLNFEKLRLGNGKTHFSSLEEIESDDAIANTEYSSPVSENLAYHCGLDFLDNPRFREMGFLHLMPNSEETRDKKFNTIEDFRRDEYGKKVTERIQSIKVSQDGGKEKIELVNEDTDMHLYNMENISNFKTSFWNNVIIKNGWTGFENKARINIPIKDLNTSGSRKFDFSAILSNKKKGAFIDFYPDRSLFSFIPKYNPYRARNEKNWDICITYPKRSDIDLFNKVMGGEKNLIRIVNYETFFNSSGVEYVVMKSKIRHNLSKNDVILVKKMENYDFSQENKGYNPENKAVKVYYLGDPSNKLESDKEHSFCVKKKDVEWLFEGGGSKNLRIGFKKVNDSVPCRYYFRWFQKLKISDSDGQSRDINVEVGKMGFSETLFGDRNAQIVIPDTIDVDGLVTNTGKEVTDLYMTIIKRNQGNRLWYIDKKTNTADVEYSHCFGSLDAGIDMEPKSLNEKEEWSADYNVHTINCLKPSKLKDYGDKEYYSSIMNIKKLESGITASDDEFLGDIVEYSPSRDYEAVIERVYYRFNTMQREEVSDDIESFKLLNETVIISDDYDKFIKHTVENQDSGGVEKECNGFEVMSRNLSTYTYRDEKGNEVTRNISANLSPEGYYYSPHMKIPVRKLSPTVRKVPADRINSVMDSITVKEYHKDPDSGLFAPGHKDGCINIRGVRILSPTNFDFVVGNQMYAYKSSFTSYKDSVTDTRFFGRIEEFYLTDKGYSLLISFPSAAVGSDFSRYAIVRPKGRVPEYAPYLAGTEEVFVYREIEPYSAMSQDDRLYNIPFANGCLYAEGNFNFYLRRQDPFGKYGLEIPEGKVKESSSLLISGDEYDDSIADYKDESDNLGC